MRYEIVTWHGENGSRFYVVDSAVQQSEQPAVVFCYGNKDEAEDAAACLNMAGAVIF